MVLMTLQKEDTASPRTQFCTSCGQQGRQGRLDLGDDIDNIAVRGTGGMRVSGVYRQLSYVRRIKPYVIFLNIWTNDLSDPQKDPVQLAREIIVATRTLGEVPSVTTIILSGDGAC